MVWSVVPCPAGPRFLGQYPHSQPCAAANLQRVCACYSFGICWEQEHTPSPGRGGNATTAEQEPERPRNHKHRAHRDHKRKAKKIGLVKSEPGVSPPNASPSKTNLPLADSGHQSYGSLFWISIPLGSKKGQLMPPKLSEFGCGDGMGAARMHDTARP